MSYELLQQDPAVYIPVILISFLVTLVAYGAFPLIFARKRKDVISKKKYKGLCYCINGFVMLLFVAVNGASSGGPYFLWTGMFSAMGINTLKDRGVLEGFHTSDCARGSTYQASPTMGSDIALETDATEPLPIPEGLPPIRFCRKCGFELIAGSEFCSKCGTAVIKE